MRDRKQQCPEGLHTTRVRAAAMLVVALGMTVFYAACAATGPTARSARVAGIPPPDSLVRVHFATGDDGLDAEALDTLARNVAWLNRHPDAVLVLEGHCDERGDAAFNLQLGDRRARRVKEGLIALRIDPDRLIMVVSRGEMRPLDPRHSADAWRQNRRVEFIVR